MRYNRNVLFTTNYAVTYDGWQKITAEPFEGYTATYEWGDYIVYTRTSTYYLLVKITKDGILQFEDYIKTIDDYNKMKKKLLCNAKTRF